MTASGADRPQLGPCVNSDCDSDDGCTCPGDRGFVESPVEREAVEGAIEYRLSWEMVSSGFAAATEARYGRDCWPVLDWSGFEWHEVSKITTDPWSQWNTLGRWAASREQPVRNVRLERRAVPAPDEGWEVI